MSSIVSKFCSKKIARVPIKLLHPSKLKLHLHLTVGIGVRSALSTTSRTKHLVARAGLSPQPLRWRVRTIVSTTELWPSSAMGTHVVQTILHAARLVSRRLSTVHLTVRTRATKVVKCMMGCWKLSTIKRVCLIRRSSTRTRRVVVPPRVTAMQSQVMPLSR